MKLTLIRTGKLEGYTTGVLYVNGLMFCHTLEPQWRNLSIEKKVKGKTAIPEGTYRIRLLQSPKFGRMMPCLLNVPHFTGILIHSGNYVGDTKGCILVGERGECGALLCSRFTFDRLYQTLEMTCSTGEEITIVVQ
ncbi:MAG: hypothetical protein IJ467_05835 [Bacteroidaceae bacterium]|nr:hypothetical protein [Bacteroidaceae bacterium]